MTRLVTFILAGCLGAIVGWFIFEPWKQDYGAVRDFLLLYGVALGITIALIIEKFFYYRKYSLIAKTLKTVPIYLIPLVGAIVIKIIFSAQTPAVRYQEQGTETHLLLLDVSGSMEGRPLRELKRAVARYLSILEEAGSTDKIGCITFSDDADLIFKPDSDYGALKRRIQRLDAGGGTDMTAAFHQADKLLADLNDTLPCDFILVSDGKPDEPDDVLQYASELAGIHINTVGVGPDYDEDLLEDVAYETNGKFYSASNIDDLTEVFEQIAVQGLTEMSEQKMALPLWRRILGWSFLGLCIGIAIGIGNKRSEMVAIGCIGGFLGGTVSAVFFILIDFLNLSSGSGARMVSFALLGACIGLTIYIVNEIYNKLRPSHTMHHDFDATKIREA